MSEEDIGIKVFYFQKYINSIKYMNENLFNCLNIFVYFTFY